MDFELYHDESKEGGYWHGMLLVPISKKDSLLHYLCQARKNAAYDYPIAIKNVRGPGKILDCAEAWIQVAVLSLMSVRKGPPPGVFLGHRVKRKKEYAQFRDILDCKLFIFREIDDHAKMTACLDYAGKVETTFRIGLKGGLHYLGSEERPIHIERMHFDGHTHYHRHLDRNRIVNRLAGLRQYCSVADHCNIIDDRSSDHTRDDCQDYGDCQLLQLTDLMVGCFRVVLMGSAKEIHNQLARPVKQIIDRYRRGYARMRNSRWYGSFCMSQCYLESEQWHFETMRCQPDASRLQMPLPFQDHSLALEEPA
jgi:hypothetical protein